MLYYPRGFNTICCVNGEFSDRRRSGLPARHRPPGSLVGLAEFGYVDRSTIAIEEDRS